MTLLYVWRDELFLEDVGCWTTFKENYGDRTLDEPTLLVCWRRRTRSPRVLEKTSKLSLWVGETSLWVGGRQVYSLWVGGRRVWRPVGDATLFVSQRNRRYLLVCWRQAVIVRTEIPLRVFGGNGVLEKVYTKFVRQNNCQSCLYLNVIVECALLYRK